MEVGPSLGMTQENYLKVWQKQPGVVEFDRLYSVKHKVGAGTYSKDVAARQKEGEQLVHAAKVLETT